MRNFAKPIFCILLFLAGFSLFGLDQTITLEYFEGSVYVDAPDGVHYESTDLEEGLKLPLGSTISTEKNGYAELRLSDSTIIRLDSNTTFTVSRLKGVAGSKYNVLDLAFGKFRAVVAKVSSTEESYRFQGNSSVCGVRGTELYMWIKQNPDTGAEEESAYTVDGEVEYWKKSAPDKKLKLGKGKYANAHGDAFASLDIPQKQLDDFNKEMAFKKLKKDDVKTLGAEPTAAPDDKSIAEGTAEPGAGEGAEAGAGMPDWLSKLLGLQIGSIVVGDKTYAKVVLQPEIAIDKFKLGLYLPVIYEKNLFDPDYWYKPEGNNEWSFGFDQTDYIAGTGDFVSDLFLKIKYLQWGELRDPFFIKLGNINNFTMGHGLLMKNYANDSEFPAVRKIGFNLGIDMTTFGFELMSNDLAKLVSDPRIAGVRAYWRPAAPDFMLAIGVSAIADLNPAADLNLPGGIDADMIGNPMFFNLAVDLDLPIVNTDPLKVIYFADLGGMLPYTRTNGEGAFSSIEEGLHTEAMFTGDAFRNYGFSTGFMGNITFLTYALDFRYWTGTFRHSFFNSAYDRNSGDIALATATYLANPDDPAFDVTNMGIYLEGGAAFANIASLTIGYMIPMTYDADGFHFGEGEDSFVAKFAIEPKAIPLVNLSGGITYERSYLVSMLMGDLSADGKELGIFDEYTVLSGEIVYGMSNVLDLAFVVSTAVARDATGAVIYESDGVTKKISATWSIETRIHF